MNEKNLCRRTFLRQASGLLAGAGVLAAGRGAPARAADAGGKRLAFFQCDVTPPLGTVIYSSYEPLTVIEHPLLAKGVILEENGVRYVLCAVDYCELLNSTHQMFRDKVAAAANTDVSRVAVQTVHQHTAPYADGDAFRLLATVENPPATPGLETLEGAADRLADAVRNAVDALAPYDGVGVGKARVERVASNRRVPIGEGKVGFRASSCRDPKFIALPEGEIDPFVQTITFFSGEKPLLRMHYYATHPQSFYGDTRASYDFVGMAREALQEQEGIFQIYFTGCAGDIAAGKYNDASPEARDGLYERMLAGMAASAAATQRIPLEAIHWRTESLLLTPRDDAGYGEAEMRAQLGNPAETPRKRYDAAYSIAFRERAHIPLALSSLQMGGIHIVHLPGEPMIPYQLYAQSLRPDAAVLVAGYADCAPMYLCLEKSFAEGGYEPSASLIVPKSEAVIRAAIQRLMGVA